MVSNTMNLKFTPYELQLKHAFTLASGSRTTTPVMLTEIELDGTVGYGELPCRLTLEKVMSLCGSSSQRLICLVLTILF